MLTAHASPYAGQWYPADPGKLHELIGETLRSSAKRTGAFTRDNGIAFVVPHAAPMYSGQVAAAAYRHVERSRPLRIVLLGFSHRQGVPGIAVPRVDTISTPLGQTRVDVDAAERLSGHPPFHASPERFLCDHSVEIQLPFLRAVAPNARVLPLYVGHLNTTDRAGAASRLRTLLDGSTIILASSDFTHFGDGFGYRPFPVDERTGTRLRRLDGEMIAAAGSLDAELFLEERRRTGATICGYEPVALLLEILRGAPGEEIFQDTLDYQTSGEITGDYSHSVSYAAMGYFPRGAFLLSTEARAALLESASRTIEELVGAGARRYIAAPPLPELDQPLGVFVTLYQDGRLKGCIGRCREPEPLRESVPKLTLAAAIEDGRFEPFDRLRSLKIEISVLSPLKRIPDPDQVIAGEHGAALECRGRSAILLPKVASERGWGADEFLRALEQKAELQPGAYRDPDARVSVFRAQVFERS